MKNKLLAKIISEFLVSKVTTALLITILLVTGAYAYGGNKIVEFQNKSVSTSTPTPKPLLTEELLLNLINKEREQRSLKPLQVSEKLSNAAKFKGEDLITKKYWDNNSPTGESPWTHIKKSGYSYSNAGINLAKDFLTATEVVKSWMQSKSTADQILDPKFTETGFSIQKDTIGNINAYIVVQYLAKPQVTSTTKKLTKSPLPTLTTAKDITIQNLPKPATWDGKIKCQGTTSGYTYNYGEITYQECSAKISQYYDSIMPTSQPTVVSASIPPAQTTVNTSSCYNQYNSDVQRANAYGGNVGNSMLSMAQSNLTNCLSSGTVTAVGTIQQDTSPRDRDGKLCSEYPPELYSYSQSMGCP